MLPLFLDLLSDACVYVLSAALLFAALLSAVLLVTRTPVADSADNAAISSDVDSTAATHLRSCHLIARALLVFLERLSRLARMRAVFAWLADAAVSRSLEHAHASRK